MLKDLNDSPHMILSSWIYPFLLCLAATAWADEGAMPRPQVFRTFMPEAGASAFAVVLTPDLVLCYDSLRGGVNQAWRGTLNLAPTLRAKINQPASVQGAVFYAESIVQPLRVNASTKTPERRFKGYRYEGDAVIFDYTLDGVTVSETLRVTGNGHTVERMWRIGPGAGAVFFLAEAQTGAEVTFTGGSEQSPNIWRFAGDEKTGFSFGMKLKSKLPQ